MNKKQRVSDNKTVAINRQEEKAMDKNTNYSNANDKNMNKNTNKNTNKNSNKNTNTNKN